MTPSDIPNAFRLGLEQLPSRRLLGILALALALTLLITSPFLFILLTLAGLVDVSPFAGEDGESWFAWTGWLLLVYVISPIALAIVSLLLDRIVTAVEARHYPNLPPPRRRSTAAALSYAFRFFALLLAVGVLSALLVALVTPLPGWLIFTAATAYLLTREYYETVALRRMPEDAARAEVQANLPTLWVAGLAVAVLLNVPILNLVAPILGVAAFTHLFHAHRAHNPD